MHRKICVHNLPDLTPDLLPEYVIAARTSTRQELLNAVGTLDFVVVVLDIDEAKALDVVLEISEVKPQLRIVGVTANMTAQGVIAAQRGGCCQVTTRPIDSQDLTAALRLALQDLHAADEVNRHVIATLGSVGGAGCTTIACHLAGEIALAGHLTALFDLDFEYGGVAQAFDVDPRYTIADLARAETIDTMMFDKVGVALPTDLRLFARPARLEEAHGIDDVAISRILGAARRVFQYIVLDLPRSLTPITGAALEAADQILLVTQLTVPSVRNARRLIEALKGDGVPLSRIELVVNREGKNKHLLSVENVERELERSVFGIVPSDYPAVNMMADLGKPISARHPVRTAIQQMAHKLVGVEEPKQKSSWLSKLRLSS